ncbi:excinuclease ABC subunit C [Aliifodinibius salipaludis]|uniref:Excinuclease ABC subunit C n=2 Tax=Fodinibius salipaludis TaxID=2032627 RepID=A0A2A2GAQ3_9BACT|nr:excinuclease ABC subunit C [Aliifodinibius salipaludis]
MAKKYHVYIITNTHHTVLYTGVTGDILKRGWQHKQKLVDGFTKRYNCTKLVYIEEYDHPQGAIVWKKQIKAGSRQHKIDFIENLNPHWKDLYEELLP